MLTYNSLPMVPRVSLSLFPFWTSRSTSLCLCSGPHSCLLFATHELQHSGSLSMEFQGRDTGMSSHLLLQEMFQNRDQTFISCIAGRFFSTESPRTATCILCYSIPVVWRQAHLAQELAFSLGGSLLNEGLQLRLLSGI